MITEVKKTEFSGCGYMSLQHLVHTLWLFKWLEGGGGRTQSQFSFARKGSHRAQQNREGAASDTMAAFKADGKPFPHRRPQEEQATVKTCMSSGTWQKYERNKFYLLHMCAVHVCLHVSLQVHMCLLACTRLKPTLVVFLFTYVLMQGWSATEPGSCCVCWSSYTACQRA